MSAAQVAVACALGLIIGWAGYEILSLRSELQQVRAQMAEREATYRANAEQLRVAVASARDRAPQPGCEPTATPEFSEPREVLVPPNGRRPPAPVNREVSVREHLTERMAVAERLPLDDAQRDNALALLMEIRRLRIAGASPEELIRVQQDLIALTGMGAGELLAELEDSKSRSLRPKDAPPIAEGETRKRFADETARRLGIAKPDAVERYVDGTWLDEDRQPEP